MKNLFRSTGQRNQRGFTLVEFILYIAISSIVVVTLTRGVLMLLQTRGKIALSLPVQQELRFATRRITETIRNAVAVNPAPASVFGSPNGMLSLAMSGSLRSPTVFSLSGSTIIASEGLTPAIALTSPSIVVQQLQFENFSAPLTPGTVKILIQAKDVANQKTFNLETSVSLRQLLNE